MLRRYTPPSSTSSLLALRRRTPSNASSDHPSADLTLETPAADDAQPLGDARAANHDAHVDVDAHTLQTHSLLDVDDALRTAGAAL